MIKAFLFDLDGTLVDTHVANFEAYKKALKDFDVEIDWPAFKQTIGLHAKDFLKVLAPKLSPEDHQKIRAAKAEYYRDFVHMTKPNKALIEFLKAMASHHPVGLVTTAGERNVDTIINHHGLAEFFTVIVHGGDVTHHKPHAEAYELALEKLQLQADEVIAFEDSASGLASAEAAGIRTVEIKDFAA